MDLTGEGPGLRPSPGMIWHDFAISAAVATIFMSP